MALTTSNARQKHYMEELLELLEEAIPERSKTTVVIEAGHFSPRLGADAFAQTSLLDALDLVDTLLTNFGKRLRIVIAILVDDLGESASAQMSYSQQQRTIESLPLGLQRVLSSSRFVKPDKLLITSERNAKNRALAQLRKIDTDSNEHLLSVHDGERLKLVLATANNTSTTLATFEGKTGNAKCPAIMGQHYADCLRIAHGRFPATQHTIIVDWSDMLDFNKVTAGARAFACVFRPTLSHNPPCDLINVFFGDAEGFVTRIHHQACPSNDSL